MSKKPSRKERQERAERERKEIALELISHIGTKISEGATAKDALVSADHLIEQMLRKEPQKADQFRKAAGLAAGWLAEGLRNKKEENDGMGTAQEDGR